MSLSHYPSPLHFRFTHSSSDDLARLKHFVESLKSPRVLSVFEDEDHEVPRPHTHTAIYTNLDKKAFSVLVRKAFPIHKGNRAFSVFDDISDRYKLECYLCKGKARGTLPVVLETNLTEEEILERHNKYWDVNEELKGGKTKKKKEKTLTWSQRVAAAYVKEYPQRVIHHDSRSKFLLYNFVLESLGKDFKSFDEIVLRRLTLGIWNSLLSGYCRYEYAKDSFARVFPEDARINENYHLI